MNIDYYRAVYFDTEFMENGETIVPLSIGLTCEWGVGDESDLYIVFSNIDHDQADDWVKENVIPHLYTGRYVELTTNEAGAYIHDWVTYKVGKPHFWADYAAYDWILLCQLYGRMIDLPDTYPMYCMDVQNLKQLVGYTDKLPEPTLGHNALSDAYNVRTRVRLLDDWAKQID